MSRIDARAIMEAWQVCRESRVNVFAPDVATRLAELPGWRALGFRDSGAGREPGVTILESVRALELLDRERRREGAPCELVVSHPSPSRRLASTRDVARTLVQGATRELLVLGYSISDGDFRRQLIRRGLDGITVTVVSDRLQIGARELLQEWPATATPLVALEGVEPDRGREWKVHGKIIVADCADALIGSANFTWSGLGRNLEFGIRVSGGQAANICRVVYALQREGWLVPARP